ncbi:MAG: hypothetical protein U0930_20870 [Pirellulales bacterium]
MLRQYYPLHALRGSHDSLLRVVPPKFPLNMLSLTRTANLRGWIASKNVGFPNACDKYATCYYAVFHKVSKLKAKCPERSLSYAMAQRSSSGAIRLRPDLLWHRYFGQLMAQARAKMSNLSPAGYDAEDAALSTFQVLVAMQQRSLSCTSRP